MKLIFMMLLMSLLPVFPVHASEVEQALDDSRATVGEFMKTLKQELQAGMQAGGPVNAVSVCNLTAPGIANTYSAREGREVSRTSLRPRNPQMHRLPGSGLCLNHSSNANRQVRM